MNKKLLAIMVCGLTAASMLTACGKNVDLTASDGTSSSTSNDSGSEEQAPPENVEIANFTAPEKGDKIIEMKIKDYGTVKIRLFPEYADRGVENFIKLAEQGYYDGLKFHRVIKDFMIQGGDPLGNGTGGECVWGDKFDGGTDPHLVHVAGALAYANSGGTDTNGSQFYIVTGTDVDDDTFAMYESYGKSFTDNQKAIYKEAGGAPFLDGNYTVFGQVIDGLDVIFKAQYVATGASDDPLEDVIMESVKVTEYNGEEIKWHLSDYNYDDPAAAEPANYTAPAEGEEIVVMDIKDYGQIKIKVFPEFVPKASENFIELAKKGYYDGLTFHRIIKDFMIQGGDPNGDGTGGESTWGGSFDGGKYYNLIHLPGAVAYANSGQYGGYTASDGSQFYIVTGEVCDAAIFDQYEQSGYTFRDTVKKAYMSEGGAPFLDGSYTVFGQVIDGLDIVFKLQNVDTDAESSKPLTDVIINKVTVEKYDGSEIKWHLSDYSEGGSSSADETAETAGDSQEESTETEAETSEETAAEDTEETNEEETAAAE